MYATHISKLLDSKLSHILAATFTINEHSNAIESSEDIALGVVWEDVLDSEDQHSGHPFLHLSSRSSILHGYTGFRRVRFTMLWIVHRYSMNSFLEFTLQVPSDPKSNLGGYFFMLFWRCSRHALQGYRCAKPFKKSSAYCFSSSVGLSG